MFGGLTNLEIKDKESFEDLPGFLCRSAVLCKSMNAAVRADEYSLQPFVLSGPQSGAGAGIADQMFSSREAKLVRLFMALEEHCAFVDARHVTNNSCSLQSAHG